MIIFEQYPLNRDIHTEIFVYIKGVQIIPINDPAIVKGEFTVLLKNKWCDGEE